MFKIIDFGEINFNIFISFRGQLVFNIKIVMLFDKAKNIIRYVLTI